MSDRNDLDGQQVLCFPSDTCHGCGEAAGQSCVLYVRNGNLYCAACLNAGREADEYRRAHDNDQAGPYAEGR